MLKKGTLLFHATEQEFRRIRGPAFFAPTCFLAKQEMGLDSQIKHRILVFVTKSNIKTKKFNSKDFVSWMIAAYSIKKTKHQAYEHVREFENGKYKEVVIKNPSKLLKFVGTISL